MEGKRTCNIMSNSVAPLREETDAVPPHARTQEFSLYSPTGARKYLNRPSILFNELYGANEGTRQTKLEPEQAVFLTGGAL